MFGPLRAVLCVRYFSYRVDLNVGYGISFAGKALFHKTLESRYVHILRSI